MIPSLCKELISISFLIKYFYLKNERISKFNKIKKERKNLENNFNPKTKIIEDYSIYLKRNRKIEYPPRNYIF